MAAITFRKKLAVDGAYDVWNNGGFVGMVEKRVACYGRVNTLRWVAPIIVGYDTAPTLSFFTRGEAAQFVVNEANRLAHARSRTTADDLNEAAEKYQGILDQDGWETLELTVRADNLPAFAQAVLDRLETLNQRPTMLPVTQSGEIVRGGMRPAKTACEGCQYALVGKNRCLKYDSPLSFTCTRDELECYIVATEDPLTAYMAREAGMTVDEWLDFSNRQMRWAVVFREIADEIEAGKKWIPENQPDFCATPNGGVALYHVYSTKPNTMPEDLVKVSVDFIMADEVEDGMRYSFHEPIGIGEALEIATTDAAKRLDPSPAEDYTREAIGEVAAEQPGTCGTCTAHVSGECDDEGQQGPCRYYRRYNGEDV